MRTILILLGATAVLASPSDAVRASLVKWYGSGRGMSAQYYKASEICEYGTQPDEAGIRKLFPILHGIARVW